MKSFILALVLAACNLQPQKGVEAPSAAPQVTVGLAAKATFRINVEELADDTWERVSSGSAWVVLNGSGSFLVTAGHVCDAEPEQRYTLTAPSGLEHTGIKVERVHSDYDLCLVSADEVVGPALPLADSMPEYDAPVAMVGAPLGIFGCDEGCGIAPISRGYYAGGTVVSMPAVNGNSGSPVFTPDGVFGVLVAGWPRFTNAGVVEPLDHLRDFLDQ